MQSNIRIFSGRFSWLQIITHIGSWLPGVYLTAAYFSNNLTINPIQELTQKSGYTALVLLVLSLACTPANTIFGFRHALKLRRPLGVYAFLYAFAHFLIFAGLDYRFDLTYLPEAIFEKPFILVGAAALLILLALAITSYKWWMKRLGKNWKRLHSLVYLAVPLVLLHFAWSQKGNLLGLQGDIVQPALFSLVTGILLLMRIPGVRKHFSNLRHTITRPKPDDRHNNQSLEPGKS